MIIPKYIEKALARRARAARLWSDSDYTISQFLRHHGLEDQVDTEDFGGGVEAIVNPEECNERIRQVILSK